ncbi:SDR family NAD(P)-dependent oxidoreductase [Elioraea rosea]|uniref:SDR family NAD(P)-dependent oxidoreductase n=1 Tax=Elioraea rosea TaxID=2492390 RepID=UPI001184C17D|nr:SDR family oxidoreductase [Elioraea rosea]
MAGRLQGKAAIITGGAGGIGSATGQLFAEEGAGIVLVDRDAAALEAVVAAIKGAVPAARVVSLVEDVGEEAAAGRIVEATTSAFGRIDILVNNAGIRAYEPLGEARSETWNDILRINLLSYAWLTREAIGYLRASGRGSVVNVSSTHAVNPRAGMGQYDVAKAGIISMTKTLAFEEAKHGLRANAVCPGLTLTPFHIRRAEAAGRTRGDLDAEAKGGCLAGRWAEPREIAYPILWLASDEASYVTASAIMVDGGRFVL